MGALLTMVLLGATVLGPELEHCRLGDPVFLSEQVGFIPDACGEVFVTRDGGLSWSPSRGLGTKGGLFSQSLSLGVAVADGSVILAGFIGTRVLRSADRGVSWSDVPIPTDQWLYAMVARGPHVWSCGSSGTVLHSGDFGRSWMKAARSPTNSDDRCISLDFLDGKKGWVAGWYGSLWATEDGGATWVRRSLPDEFTPKAPHERTLDRVLRVSDSLGYVNGPAGTFRTRDGGLHWERVPLPSGARVVRALGPHRVLTDVQGEAVDLSTKLWPRGDGAVSIERDGLVVWSSDGARRVWGLCGAAGPEQPRPESIRAVHGQVRVGLGAGRAFLSLDGGETWRVLSPLPGHVPVEQFMLLDDRRGLARSGAKVFRSDDSGRHWTETTSPLDAADLARALGEKVEDPLGCLAAPGGQLTLTFGARGCFGGNTNQLTLTWEGSGGVMTTTFDPIHERTPTSRRLAAAQVRDALAEVHARASRPEVSSGCSSTTGYEVTLDVSCTLDGRNTRQVVTMASHDCGPERAPGVGGETSSGHRGGRARAIDLHQWALGVASAP